MRIISKFKDYYDSARAWRDETICYVRNTIEYNTSFDSKTKPPKHITETINKVSYMASLPNIPYGNNCFIGFCGKLYPFYRTIEGDIFYSLEKLEESYKEKVYNKEHTLYNLTYKERLALLDRTTLYGLWGQGNLTRKTWKSNLKNQVLTYKIDIHRELRSPVFFVGNREIIINPILRKYNFASQVNPYTAYQELAMYVGNALVTTMNPDIERTDELIRDSKGMDKWSFRKRGKNSKD